MTFCRHSGETIFKETEKKDINVSSTRAQDRLKQTGEIKINIRRDNQQDNLAKHAKAVAGQHIMRNQYITTRQLAGK